VSSFAQTSEGDLALTLGRLTLIDGTEEKAQKLRNRLRMFEGEWFLDVRVGVPWFSVVFVKAPDLEVVKRLLRKVILATPGIVSVTELSVEFDRGTRELEYEFTAVDDTGVTIEGGSGSPFIVEL
jgi:hypothetical protein